MNREFTATINLTNKSEKDSDDIIEVIKNFSDQYVKGYHKNNSVIFKENEQV